MRSPLPFLALLASISAAEKPRWSDTEVLRLAYDAQYVLPDGYSVDPLLKAGARFYCHQRHWVTNDADEARRLVETHLKRSDVEAKKIAETRITARGFDFRVGRTWFRVHDPRYFAWAENWVAFDTTLGRNGKPRYLGTLGAKHRTKRALREFAEYDWLMRHRGGSGEKVLASESKATETRFVQVLETIGRCRGDWGVADTVFRWRVVYSMEIKTGRTTKSHELVREIRGR